MKNLELLRVMAETTFVLPNGEVHFPTEFKKAVFSQQEKYREWGDTPYDVLDIIHYYRQAGGDLLLMTQLVQEDKRRKDEVEGEGLEGQELIDAYEWVDSQYEVVEWFLHDLGYGERPHYV